MAQSKFSKLCGTTRDPEELQCWFFSLIPLGIAFLFFHFVVLSMGIPNRLQVMVVGTAAGVVGLQAYWVMRGWRRNHLVTIVLGLVSIAAVLAGTWLFLNYTS